jgi:hypothetical protein
MDDCYILVLLVFNLFFGQISAIFQPLLGQCNEPNRHKAPTFAKDNLGCGWRLLFHNLIIHPFHHLHH